MLTDKQKKICEKYSERDENGKVHCNECPLVINAYALMCKAVCHYDRHEREWVFDEEYFRGPKIVEKKILTKYYKAVVDGSKTFELRKDEDDIQVGDVLELREFDGEKFTGRGTFREVTYVLRNCPEYGLMDGYCIIGIQEMGEEKF